MVTAISRRDRLAGRRAVWSAAALVVGIAVVRVAIIAGNTQSTSAAFGWLRPAAAPTGWHAASTRTGATLAYPPGWRTIQTDSGTASAAPAGRAGSFAGYLNATPRDGEESLANWRSFRLAHLAEDKDRNVRLIAAAQGLRFRTGHGSCVIDVYSTTRSRFREIACIVAGRHGTTVIVAAAPAATWAQKAAVLERAVSAFDA